MRILRHLKAATAGVLLKKGILRNIAKFTRNTCAKTPAQKHKKHLCLSLQLYLKKGLWHREFSVNFANFLRTPF